jgi:hypothetical protein
VRLQDYGYRHPGIERRIQKISQLQQLTIGTNA